jgi:hypothetical protein
MEDHLNHLCPRLVEAQNLLVQQQTVVLMNPFPHGKNMAQASTYSSMEGGNQGPPMSIGNTSVANVYMLKGDAHIDTRSRNPSIPLHIENTLGETMTCIPKGPFKKASPNSNVRVA